MFGFDLKSAIAGKSIALVGHAKGLSATQQGKDIDQHDIVIRMKDAQNQLPASHGTKTTWLATNRIVPRQRLRELSPEHIFFMATHDRWRIAPFVVAGWSVSFYPAKQWQALSAKLGNARPSTGMMTIDHIVNAGTFASFDLYGFDFFESGSLTKRKTDRPAPHEFGREKDLVLQWVEADPRFTHIPPSAA
jgi:hypothetical protein